ILISMTSLRTHNISKTILVGTSTGLDHISVEHLKYASLRLAPLLAICFTSCFIHGFLPDSLMTVLLVPVVKDKAGKVGSSDNYRPIALANTLSKVVEAILLSRFCNLIGSTENQFGFKSNHGTDMCIFALK
uniref:Reverse transcriptase domain-containing protein n=1 Tax=Monopterus albus TaxID=43700 RepID=A0A3Q3JVI4_MONAL